MENRNWIMGAHYPFSIKMKNVLLQNHFSNSVSVFVRKIHNIFLLFFLSGDGRKSLMLMIYTKIKSLLFSLINYVKAISEWHSILQWAVEFICLWLLFMTLANVDMLNEVCMCVHFYLHVFLCMCLSQCVCPSICLKPSYIISKCLFVCLYVHNFIILGSKFFFRKKHLISCSF